MQVPAWRVSVLFYICSDDKPETPAIQPETTQVHIRFYAFGGVAQRQTPQSGVRRMFGMRT